MNLIFTQDRNHYRRWVNVIPSFIFPGSTQYLAGRKTAGALWGAVYLVSIALLLIVVIHPKTGLSVYNTGILGWIKDIICLAAVIDGLREPLPRLRISKWATWFGCWLCIFALPILGVCTLVVHPYKMPTHAMQPTLMGNRKSADGKEIGGDYIFVNRLIYHFSDPQRGDIVIFTTKGINSPFVKDRADYAKRIVGLPGETISINPPYVVVNGRNMVEPPIFRNMAEGKNGLAGYVLADRNDAVLKSTENKITLGADEYLVLGDNSARSLDGRHFGPIKRKSIIGKAFYIYAPANRKGWIE